MLKLVLVSGLIAVSAGNALAQGARRLPFPDGTYVTDPTLCRAKSQQELVDRHGDSIATMVRNINGSKFNNAYETFCEIRNVVQSGNNVRFRLVCEAEGETQMQNGSWIKIDERTFKIGSRVFASCGRLIP